MSFRKLPCGHIDTRQFTGHATYNHDGAGTVASTLVICPKCGKRHYYDTVRRKDGSIYSDVWTQSK